MKIVESKASAGDRKIFDLAEFLSLTGQGGCHDPCDY